MLPYFAACQVLTPLNELCVFETAFWEMRGCAGILRKIIDRTWTDMPYDFWQCLSFVLGSPPHTRGKGERGYLRGLRKRITPAHAGKRLRQQANRRRQRDHPRTRGEKNKLADGTSSISGSPPHTRGKVTAHLCYRFQRKDHPRTRGEKLRAIWSVMKMKGSPPHTRGKAVNWVGQGVGV